MVHKDRKVQVINRSRFYEKFGDADVVAPLESTAICDQGDSVTGGGYSTGGIAEAIVVLSRPGANDLVGWWR